MPVYDVHHKPTVLLWQLTIYLDSTAYQHFCHLVSLICVPQFDSISSLLIMVLFLCIGDLVLLHMLHSNTRLDNINAVAYN